MQQIIENEQKRKKKKKLDTYLIFSWQQYTYTYHCKLGVDKKFFY